MAARERRDLQGRHRHDRHGRRVGRRGHVRARLDPLGRSRHSGNPGFSSKIKAAVSVSGGTPTNDDIDAGDAPTIFLHGTGTRSSRTEWAVQNAAAMYNLGILTVLEPIEGAGQRTRAD